MKLLGTLRSIGLALAGALLLAQPAQALPLNISNGHDNNYGLGSLATWAQNSIGSFNSHGHGGSWLPNLGNFSFQIPSSGGNTPSGWSTSSGHHGTMSLTLPTACDYIVIKWGGSNAHGATDCLYYIGGACGTFTFDRPTGTHGGLPDIFVYGCNPSPSPCDPPPSVPDGGTTMTLLGVGMVGVAMLRRKLTVIQTAQAPQ